MLCPMEVIYFSKSPRYVGGTAGMPKVGKHRKNTTKHVYSSWTHFCLAAGHIGVKKIPSLKKHGCSVQEKKSVFPI